MHFEFTDSILPLDTAQWNALWPNAYPFTRYEFLAALEESGCTLSNTGWQPMHCVAYENGVLCFAMPLYLKTHSYGEYVFDWAWADAYARAGLDYYPKLLNAIPFTPATGPRWASLNPITHNNMQSLYEALIQQAQHCAASSIHILFPWQANRDELTTQHQTKLNHETPEQYKNVLPQNSFIERHGCQYHWFNHDYQNFDDFLAEFSSRKRKNIRKERNKTQEFTFQFLEGETITSDHWALFYQLYHRTYFKRSGRPGYLNESFFTSLSNSMPESIVLALVMHKGVHVAGAMYFKDEHTLYGRYWGTMTDIDGLHFETCYYQGIEYAIKHGLKRFDPGAQGEHKIQRGFQPVTTCSYHWLSDSRFAKAVADYCRSEQLENSSYIQQARDYLPFKEETALTPVHVLLGDTHSEHRADTEEEHQSEN